MGDYGYVSTVTSRDRRRKKNKASAQARGQRGPQDLMGWLAARLHGEAEAVVAEVQQRFAAQLQERSEALEQARQEAIALSNQLQRTEAALYEERTAHTSAQHPAVSGGAGDGGRPTRRAHRRPDRPGGRARSPCEIAGREACPRAWGAGALPDLGEGAARAGAATPRAPGAGIAGRP